MDYLPWCFICNERKASICISFLCHVKSFFSSDFGCDTEGANPRYLLVIQHWSDHIYSYGRFSFIFLHIISLIDLCALVASQAISGAYISLASIRLIVLLSTSSLGGVMIPYRLLLLPRLCSCILASIDSYWFLPFAPHFVFFNAVAAGHNTWEAQSGTDWGSEMSWFFEGT